MLLARIKLPVMLLLMGSLSFFSKDKPVDLLEHNLINLDKAIESAKFGDVSDEGEEGDQESDETDMAETEKNRFEHLTFSIKGKELYLYDEKNPKKSVAPEDVAGIIHDASLNDLKVTLKDDYADSQTYKDVDSIIEKFSLELGFEYEEL